MAAATPEFVREFETLRRHDTAVAGGKGANLGEMTAAGLPVPPGFVVTGQAYLYALDVAGCRQRLLRLVNDTDLDDSSALKLASDELRAAVREAGMPENVRAAVIEAFRSLGPGVRVAVRSSAIAEDPAEASFGGGNDTFTNVVEETLVERIVDCWASLWDPRVVAHRHGLGLVDEPTIAVVVQRMVDSEAAGVMFTADPISQDRGRMLVEAAYGLGEVVVGGQVEPDIYSVSRSPDPSKGDVQPISARIGSKGHRIVIESDGTEARIENAKELREARVLDDARVLEVASLGLRIENHYGSPQDVEWAFADGKMYVVQSRSITALEWATGRTLLTGLGASPGIVAGNVRVMRELQVDAKVAKDEILVVPMTSPDWVPVMRNAGALVTDDGGMTCHAAIVSRELRIPCVVGTGNATRLLKRSQIVTVDGARGDITTGDSTKGAPSRTASEPRVEERIEKQVQTGLEAPNLRDYERERASFSWEAAREELDGLPGGRGLNLAYEAIGRHVARGDGDQTAIIWLGKKGERQEITYSELDALTNRFANVLAELGVEPGDRVYSLAGRIPELYVAALGSLKHRAIFCPLFSAFGPEPIAQRLNLGEAKALLTTERLYKRRIAGIRNRIPTLEHVVVVADPKRPEHPEDTVDWEASMSEASSEYDIGETDPETPALLHFTSGTTGTPKGAYHVHQAVVTHYVTGKLALDMHPGDIYWCTADPGWVTGTSYGISAPLTNRVTMIVDEAEFDSKRWYQILEEEKVQIWYTAPTAIRMLMKAGSDLPRSKDLSALRFMGSVGEPLNPQAVVWGQEVFGKPFHDNWWQTETGGIMIANYASMDVKPGSMGKPIPGVTAAIVCEGDDGHLREVDAPDEQGELALRPDWPSVFRGYWNNRARYEACFRDGWYLSGDLARRDDEGYYWFVGRADDVIKSAGHLIGPFEVESVIMKHPAVAEVGVIGKPDPVAGTIIKAFVSLHPGHDWSQDLQTELLSFGRKNLGTAAPREIDYCESLPKTRSGKIMRRLLKARELGLPEGDTSTLEGGDS